MVAGKIGKISSTFDSPIIPGERRVQDIIEDGKRQAIALCEEAGGDPSNVEIVELETIPEPYAMDGSFRLVIRVVSTIKDIAALGRQRKDTEDEVMDGDSLYIYPDKLPNGVDIHPDSMEQSQIDANTYHPNIRNGCWNVSETDIEFLIAGTGVLGVGCIGEATNYLLSLKACLREGRNIRIISCSSVGANDVICPPLFIVSRLISTFILFVFFLFF